MATILTCTRNKLLANLLLVILPYRIFLEILRVRTTFMYFESTVLRNTDFMFKIKHYKLKHPQTKKVAYGHVIGELI